VPPALSVPLSPSMSTVTKSLSPPDRFQDRLHGRAHPMSPSTWNPGERRRSCRSSLAQILPLQGAAEDHLGVSGPPAHERSHRPLPMRHAAPPPPSVAEGTRPSSRPGTGGLGRPESFLGVFRAAGAGREATDPGVRAPEARAPARGRTQGGPGPWALAELLRQVRIVFCHRTEGRRGISGSSYSPSTRWNDTFVPTPWRMDTLLRRDAGYLAHGVGAQPQSVVLGGGEGAEQRPGRTPGPCPVLCRRSPRRSRAAGAGRTDRVPGFPSMASMAFSMAQANARPAVGIAPDGRNRRILLHGLDVETDRAAHPTRRRRPVQIGAQLHGDSIFVLPEIAGEPVRDGPCP
jgi:hypothetical protein